MSAVPPLIAKKIPANIHLEKNKKYFWCSCGRSKNQPFCDGSHVGTNLSPKEFIAESTGKFSLCQCKSTANPPFCDGSHAKLAHLEVGDPTPSQTLHQTVPSAVPTPEEPTVARIHELARDGLSKLGHHGEMGSMGVPRAELPHWDDIQILTAQMANKPLLDDVPVATSVTIGPRAQKPLSLDIPLFVSDMSFGALSEEAKIALAKGAELAGTGICSGEGGMLAEEKAENSRYFYELASAQFGWNMSHVKKVQAFHFKGGQGAKTGTGGHLPGEKVEGKIAQVRGLKPGQDAISPATFLDLQTPADFRKLGDEVREYSGGIPIGFKLSANHIEDDIDFALEAGADYIILDGRGGGTGAAPLIFRDHISVPTIPALARARHHLDQCRDISGLRRLSHGHRLYHRARGKRRLRSGDRLLDGADLRHAHCRWLLAAASGRTENRTAGHRAGGGIAWHRSSAARPRLSSQVCPRSFRAVSARLTTSPSGSNRGSSSHFSVHLVAARRRRYG